MLLNTRGGLKKMQDAKKARVKIAHVRLRTCQEQTEKLEIELASSVEKLPTVKLAKFVKFICDDLLRTKARKIEINLKGENILGIFS